MDSSEGLFVMNYQDIDNQAGLSCNASILGLHYFPDQEHYTAKDLSLWLPLLQELHIKWLVLFADSRRAIPESFLAPLVAAGIQPVLWFRDSLAHPPDPHDVQPLLRCYGQWGVRHVIFFDRPNMQASWPRSTWASANIVEKLLDGFLPLAKLAEESGLSPVLPPLQPGGDYWDTTFLRTLLRSLRKRIDQGILRTMELSAYGWTQGHSLAWGAGGPERWPVDGPSLVTSDQENHLGFHVYEWYLALAESELGVKLPLLMLQAGLPADGVCLGEGEESRLAARTGELVSDLLSQDPGALANRIGSAVPEEWVSVNFWLLSATTGDKASCFAWFSEDGKPTKIGLAVEQAEANAPGISDGASTPELLAKGVREHPLRHYLLVPVYPWGISEWHLKALQPLIQKDHPVVGFSVREARMAKKVTVVGDPSIFPDETVRALRLAGCEVERLPLTGMDLARSETNR